MDTTLLIFTLARLLALAACGWGIADTLRRAGEPRKDSNDGNH